MSYTLKKSQDDFCGNNQWLFFKIKVRVLLPQNILLRKEKVNKNHVRKSKIERENRKIFNNLD